ncbi:flagellin FlaB [Borreliella yangtzensis]|nr:flagellin FlaB [Borreliella yangtzensis]WKC74981.1 flagellin FlaB [Borreliella yangtzensis]
MIINHNTSAINASRNNGINAANLSKTQEKLSSGYRINRASDDAAGMGVSGKINAQIRGLSQASRNTSKAINFIQTTEGNLNEVEKVLVRMKELAVQSGNGTYSDSDRGSIQIEIEQLTDEINRIADQAQYNQMHMLSNKSAAQNVKTAEELGMQPAKINTPASLSGSQASWTLRVHVGANQDEAIAVNIYAANVANLFSGEGAQSAQAAPVQEGAQQEGAQQPAPATAPSQGGVNSPVNVTTTVDANTSLAKIENAIRMVSDQRANLGAFQNRLESIKNSTEYAIENLKASYAQIKDATMTDEVVAATTNSILTQSAMAMIAQANQVPQYVLSLLR